MLITPVEIQEKMQCGGWDEWLSGLKDRDPVYIQWFSLENYSEAWWFRPALFLEEYGAVMTGARNYTVNEGIVPHHQIRHPGCEIFPVRIVPCFDIPERCKYNLVRADVLAAESPVFEPAWDCACRCEVLLEHPQTKNGASLHQSVAASIKARFLYTYSRPVHWGDLFVIYANPHNVQSFVEECQTPALKYLHSRSVRVTEAQYKG